MSAGTSIEWTDNSWNCVRGCSRISEGCRNCYAEHFAARMSQPGQWGHGFATMTPSGPRWTGVVRLIPEKLHEPLSWKKPRRIFVNSTSDLFHEGLSDMDIAQVFAVMVAAPRHTYQILTKRPDRMKAWVEWAVSHRHIVGWPFPHVWLGVSVEDQVTADVRVPLLLQTPAAVRFLSVEPLLGPVRPPLQRSTCCGKTWLSYFNGSIFEKDSTYCPTCRYALRELSEIHWVIVGGESGHDARPLDVAWLRAVVEQCRTAQVPVFVKQMGAKPTTDHRTRPAGEPFNWTIGLGPKGNDMSKWPEDLRVREFPR